MIALSDEQMQTVIYRRRELEPVNRFRSAEKKSPARRPSKRNRDVRFWG